jgi:hypothetical protein
MKDDGLLRDAVAQRMSTHQTLEELMSEIEQGRSVEDLEDALISSWESEHPEHIEIPREKSTAGKILLFTGPLAAAAALIILLGLPLQTGPIRWKSDYGTAPHLRGNTATQTAYSQSELEWVDELLRLAVERNFSPASKNARWSLEINLQELTNGALAAEISGHSKDRPEQILRWNRDFQPSENLRSEIPRFGKQIARDLTAQEN